MHVRKISQAVRVRVKRLRGPDLVAFASLVVALLASAASVVQAGLLASQVWTPYRTSLYVRQLEISGSFYGAAHEQWAAIIDLNTLCLRPEYRWSDGPTYHALSTRFSTGSTRLHDAFAGTIASFPDLLHDDAAVIWRDNEYFVETVVMPSANCDEFVRKYEELDVRARADTMHERALRLVDDMRLLLRVDRWSRSDIEEERARRTATRDRRKRVLSETGEER